MPTRRAARTSGTCSESPLFVVTLAMILAFCSGCAGQVVTRTVRFTNVTPNAPMRIVGWLVRPHGDGPFPAVVQFHGCAGVEAESFRWARWLADRGYVSLVVDSFGPRGVKTD